MTYMINPSHYDPLIIAHINFLNLYPGSFIHWEVNNATNRL